MPTKSLFLIFFISLFSASAFANYPINSSRDLEVTTVSCLTSELDSDFHIKEGDKIGLEMIILESKLRFQKGDPISLTYDVLNEKWEYTTLNMASYKDSFPCSDLGDTLKMTLK